MGRPTLSTLAIVRIFVGVSVACLVTALLLPQTTGSPRNFLVGFATGMLIATFCLLLGAGSITTKDEARSAESEIQTLRLH